MEIEGVIHAAKAAELTRGAAELGSILRRCARAHTHTHTGIIKSTSVSMRKDRLYPILIVVVVGSFHDDFSGYYSSGCLLSSGSKKP